MKCKVTCLVVVHLSVILTAPAAEAIRGAASVLKEVEDAAAKKDLQPEGVAGKLAADLEQFKAEAPKLDAKVAVQRWLDLVTKVTEARPEMAAIRRGKNLSGRQLVSALPPPTSWKALAEAIRARPVAKETTSRVREFALQLLAATLTGDARAREKVLGDIEAATAAPLREGLAPHAFRHILDELRIHNAETPEQLMNALERRIFRADPDSDNTIQVPDLVPLFGQQRAEAFLRRAFTNKVALSLDYESETTQKLARKVAQSMVSELKLPQWSLAHSVDATELFEAMQARFGKDDEDRRDRFGRNDYEFQSAKTYYFLGLIVQNRQDDAVNVASEFQKERNESLPMEGLRALERTGHSEELAAFFRKLLASNPDLPFWEAYFQVAAKAGQIDDMLAFARTTLEKVEEGKTRAKILENFHLALLAADHVDEGVAELRKLLVSPSRDFSDRTTPALRLMRLGVVLTNEAWVNEGIAAWRKISDDTSRMWPGDSALHEVVNALADRNRASEAETILVELLASAVKQKTEAYSIYNSPPGSAPLTALAFLYARLGRQRTCSRYSTTHRIGANVTSESF